MAARQRLLAMIQWIKEVNMSKWTSRKFILAFLTFLGGGATAGTGAIVGDKEVVYVGIATAVASVVAYLKSEKDVDAAREGATNYYECDCECPSCKPKVD